jgi:hypothetical protein
MKPLANLNPKREPKGVQADRSSVRLCENFFINLKPFTPVSGLHQA